MVSTRLALSQAPILASSRLLVATTPASRICHAVHEAAACVSTEVSARPALVARLLVEPGELGAARVGKERLLVFEDRHRERVLRLGQRHQRARRGVHVEVLRRLVVDLLHRVEQEVAVEADRADPDEVGLGVLHPVGDRAEVAVAEVPFEEQHLRQAALLQHLARAGAHEGDRRELARHDRDGLGRLGAGGQRVEHARGHRVLRLRAERPGRERELVLGERGHAEGVVHQDLVVALRHAHRREDRAGGVGAHQQVDLVGGDELLVERARQVGLGLVVLDDPLDLPAEEAAALVELLDVDLADQLVDLRRRRERPGEGERAADAHRRARLRERQAGGAGKAGRDDGAAGEGGTGHGRSPGGLVVI